jgi:hypothetical protein
LPQQASIIGPLHLRYSWNYPAVIVPAYQAAKINNSEEALFAWKKGPFDAATPIATRPGNELQKVPRCVWDSGGAPAF